jgi:hypothetical protein
MVYEIRINPFVALYKLEFSNLVQFYSFFFFVNLLAYDTSYTRKRMAQ